jgi:polysaccharide biosynthesis protein PslH
VPLRIGGGTRLKVVEALAMAKPVVSTTLGCEGIDVEDGTHLLVADTADAFTDSIGTLFDDREGAAALGRRGRTLVEEAYSWDRSGETLLAFYDRLCAPVGTGS